jgi:small-conductance mechanosensitive channel
MDERNNKHVTGAMLGMISLMISLFILIYVITVMFPIIPPNFSKYINVFFIALIVYVILKIVLTVVGRYIHRYMSPSRAHPIMFIVGIIGYFILGVVVLASLGINVSSLILGGSIISVVLGLASQSVLANQFAGILLTVVRPFRIGDYVFINTWQYGGAYPVVFPKFFSVDRIEATGFGGQVTNLTINYTTLKLSSGDIVRIPNAIVIQSAIILRKPGITVQARYEIPKYIPYESIAGEIEKRTASMKDYSGEFVSYVDETTMNTYILILRARFNVIVPDQKRGEIMLMLMSLIEPMKV